MNFHAQENSKQLLTELSELQVKVTFHENRLSKTPLAVQNLQACFFDHERTTPEIWVGGMLQFVGNAIEAIYDDSPTANMVNLESMVPAHCTMLKDINAARDKIVAQLCHGSTASTEATTLNAEWPPVDEIRRLGLDSFLDKARKDVEDSVSVQLLNALPVNEMASFDEIEKDVKICIANAIQLSPRLDEMFGKINLVVLRSIADKHVCCQQYTKQCGDIIASRGHHLKPAKMQRNAEIGTHGLDVLEDKLLKHAEFINEQNFKMVQTAFPPNGFNNAVELNTVFTALGTLFGTVIAGQYMNGLPQTDAANMIPCAHCNSDVYSVQLDMCKSLADASPCMLQSVKAHADYVATITLARSIDMEVFRRIDALATLQSVPTISNGCNCWKDEIENVVEMVLKKT